MTLGATASELDELRRQQDDVLTVDQAFQFFEPATVRARLRRDVWQAPHARVVVLHNGPLTWSQRLWVASLAAPAGAALWGGTAAELDGFRDQRASDEVHVVLPPGSRRIPLDWVQTHWSSQLGSSDVHPLARPRRTRLPRSVLDLASDAADERRAAQVVFAAAQQRLVAPDAMRQSLTRRGPCRHHALVLETLDDIEGGIHSVPEKEFDRIVSRAGLPRPARQAIRRRPNGRYYLDVLWELYGLAVEVDGGHHRTVAQWDDDLDRTALVVAGGLRLIRFSSYAVRRRAERVRDILTVALTSGGWRS